MSGVKHTPGPWSLGEIGGGYIMIDAPNHSGLASVVWQMEDDRLCGDNSPEKEANARLFCAAPDLLEALEQLLGNAEIARFHLKDTEEGMIVGSALFDTIQQARAAIARARGES